MQPIYGNSSSSKTRCRNLEEGVVKLENALNGLVGRRQCRARQLRNVQHMLRFYSFADGSVAFLLSSVLMPRKRPQTCHGLATGRGRHLGCILAVIRIVKNCAGIESQLLPRPWDTMLFLMRLLGFMCAEEKLEKQGSVLGVKTDYSLSSKK